MLFRSSDNQPGVEIHVLQGERQFSKDNKTIGKFKLDDIPPAPRGVPQVEVTFDIDANGILNVSAKDLGTGKEQKITITASSGLSKDEIERMRKDAEAHAEDDRLAREAVEARNEADNIVYRCEKMLRDAGTNLPDTEKTKIEAAINEVKTVLKGEDIAAIKAAVEKLQTASAELYQAAAQKAQGAADATGSTTSSASSGDTKDASKKDEGPIIDAEVVDEKKS